MIVEIHVLKNYAPSNLNRDDTGSPKNCMFGNVLRGRISSQCLKKNIREYPGFTKLMAQWAKSARTRSFPEIIGERLAADGVDEKYIKVAKEQAAKFWEEGKKKNTDQGTADQEKKEEETYRTAQIVAFTPNDIDEAVRIIENKIEKSGKLTEFKKKETKVEILKDLETRVHCPVTLDIALAGRMVTADAFKNVDASLQVAHALTTNRLVQESDYYTAVDDLIQDSGTQLGAAMIGDTEYNSSCYYEYFMLDVDKLQQNLKFNDLGIVTIEAIVAEVIKAIAFTNPTGKQNGFAANELPRAILIECKDDPIPVSYANAFVKPVYGDSQRNLIESSIDALAQEVANISDKYQLDVEKRIWFTVEADKHQFKNLAEECANFQSMLDSLKTCLKK